MVALTTENKASGYRATFRWRAWLGIAQQDCLDQGPVRAQGVNFITRNKKEKDGKGLTGTGQTYLVPPFSINVSPSLNGPHIEHGLQYST